MLTGNFLKTIRKNFVKSGNCLLLATVWWWAKNHLIIIFATALTAKSDALGQGEELDPEKIDQLPFEGEYQIANAMAAVGEPYFWCFYGRYSKTLGFVAAFEMRMQFRGAKDRGYLWRYLQFRLEQPKVGVRRTGKQCACGKEMGGLEPHG